MQVGDGSAAICFFLRFLPKSLDMILAQEYFEFSVERGRPVIKPLWALTGLALLGTAGVAGTLIVASPGGEEEVVQQVETATPTAAATSAIISPTTSPIASATPIHTAAETPPATATADVPPDWQTYADPSGSFTLRYPPNWFLDPDSDRVASWDLSTWTNSRYPSGGVLVDFGRRPSDPSDGIPDGATDSELAGYQGWRLVQSGEGEAPWRESQTVAADVNGFRYYAIGFFEDPDAGKDDFMRVVNSFTIQP